MIVQCPNCLKRYRISEAKSALLRVRCRACGNEFLASASHSASHEVGRDQGTVTAVVADIQRDFRNMVVEVLRRQDFHLYIAEDGETALKLAESKQPRLLFVNPYLPKMMGIDLIAKLRSRSGKSPTIFLLGAIHDSKRYRRRPESLYGADDYFDEGANEDTVLRKLRYHLNIQLDAAEEGAAEDVQAHRLAKIVFTDLLVYEPERMKQVRKVEDFFNLFREEAAEGRKYIEERVPGKGNLLRAVVADYISRKQSDPP